MTTLGPGRGALMMGEGEQPAVLSAPRRTVRHVQQQMALVRMFANFIRWMHR